MKYKWHLRVEVIKVVTECLYLQGCDPVIVWKLVTKVLEDLPIDVDSKLLREAGKLAIRLHWVTIQKKK